MTALLALLSLVLIGVGTVTVRRHGELWELLTLVLWVTGFITACVSLAMLLPEGPLCVRGHEEYQSRTALVGRTLMTTQDRVWVCDERRERE